ncbi:hypothetical protein GCM10022237_08170 [Nocardioides ginsengisoli]|uniref:HEAT repeat domain-containing protein n=1 Tax=Nocardioides ginsengisoli TaxID=363868 RepID=A0ABW3W2F6_9ACTN
MSEMTVEHAVALLRSTHPPDIEAAESWLTAHPEAAVPALVEALHTPSAQAAAVLLGAIGDDGQIAALVAAHRRGGEGLRSAVERGLRRNGSAAALAALRSLDDPADG